MLEDGAVPRGYTDPVLEQDDLQYCLFLLGLLAAGLIGFTDSPRVEIGAFCMAKKNSRLRLVLDARPANRLFRRPPSAVLGSMESRAGCRSRSAPTCLSPRRTFVTSSTG